MSLFSKEPKIFNYFYTFHLMNKSWKVETIQFNIFKKEILNKLINCYGLQIRAVEEQLKQRVIGKRYCISRKRKSYEGSTSRAWLAVRLSNVS